MTTPADRARAERAAQHLPTPSQDDTLYARLAAFMERVEAKRQQRRAS